MQSAVLEDSTRAGASSEMSVSVDVRATSASVEMRSPGRIAPPRNAPSADNAVILVAHVDHDAGQRVLVLCGDRGRDKVGADLQWVVEPDLQQILIQRAAQDFRLYAARVPDGLGDRLGQRGNDRADDAAGDAGR